MSSRAVIVANEPVVKQRPNANDAFGNLRTTGGVFSQFDSLLVNELNTGPTGQWDTKVSGAGSSVTFSGSYVSLTCGTGATDFAKLQTKRYFIYEPGKSLVIKMTGSFAPAQANQVQEIGYGDDTDGIFLRYSTAGLQYVRKSSAGDPLLDGNDEEVIDAANFSEDPLDGSGPSGITFDEDSTFLLTIDLQYLGVGRVRLGLTVENDEEPFIIYFHQSAYSNISGFRVPYLSNPNLPVHYHIYNTGTTSSSADLRAICTTVGNEGGTQPFSRLRAKDTELTSRQIVGGGPYEPIFSIRLNSSFNRRAVKLLKWYAQSESDNDQLSVKLIKNATLTGANWQTLSDSYVDYDTSATSYSNGIEIDSDVTAETNQVSSTRFSTDEFLSSTIDGVSDTYTIIAASFGNAADVYAGMQWKEFFG